MDLYKNRLGWHKANSVNIQLPSMASDGDEDEDSYDVTLLGVISSHHNHHPRDHLLLLLKSRCRLSAAGHIT